MHRLLLATTLLTALATPAAARLQLSIGDGTSTFSCFDGQLGCDVSGGPNNLLTINTTVGGFFVELTLTQSSFAPGHNVLQLSSSSIINNGATPGTLTFVAGDTDFVPPVSSIQESASLTFNDAVGSAASTLKFWADPLNTQGANPTNTPGPLLFSVPGTPTTDPDSFAGTHNSPFSASGPFSMTEGASLNLIAGGSITGFNESMTSGVVPEPQTWALMGVGFGFMAWLGLRRRKPARFALEA
jgi:hypothetical protein